MRALAALPVLVALAYAADARAYHERGHEWVNGTAYTLGAGEVSLGLLRWEVGILDELTVGVNVPAWVVGPFFGTVIPNGTIKLRDWLHGPVAVAVQGQFLYVDAGAILDRFTDGGNASTFLSLVMNVSGSVEWNDALSSSLQLSYTSVGVSGDSDGLAFEGTAVLDSLSLTGLFEWRLSKVFALHLLGNVLLYRAAPTLSVMYAPDPATTVDAELEANFVPPIGAWNLVPAIAIGGEYINFRFGLGYGHRWLPVMGLVLRQGLVLDLDFFVRF